MHLTYQSYRSSAYYHADPTGQELLLMFTSNIRIVISVNDLGMLLVPEIFTEWCKKTSCGWKCLDERSEECQPDWSDADRKSTVIQITTLYIIACFLFDFFHMILCKLYTVVCENPRRSVSEVLKPACLAPKSIPQ